MRLPRDFDRMDGQSRSRNLTEFPKFRIAMGKVGSSLDVKTKVGQKNNNKESSSMSCS
jgi:hypothetical protein